MSGSFYSDSWYRVASLKPRLRRHTLIHRHIYRGQTWYVLQDEATGQFHRFTPAAHQIIGMFDGRRTLQQVWESACEQLGDDMPAQDDIIRLLSQLFQANAIHSDVIPDIAELQERSRSYRRQQFLQRIRTPLAIRVPLVDPERFLNRTMNKVRPLMGRAALIVWLCVVACAGVLLALHWEPLTRNAADRVLGLENVFLIALIYPFVKAIHELGHAYTVKRWGGEVHEIGIMFLVFFPVPYVDASAASAFENKWQRMLVGAAGILVELFLAALAMIVWTMAEPGAVRTVAFNTMVISGVSTVFFNGNPLLRFDAYYVLADFLEIPNLATRSNRYIGYLLKRYAFGVERLSSPADSRREGAWLTSYAIASFMYRVIIMFVIALFVISKLFFLGVLLALWVLYSSIVGPLMKTLSKPITDPELRQKRPRVVLVASIACVAVLVLVAAVPVPYSTYAQGVLVANETAALRSQADAFVRQIHATDGAQVAAGELLVELDQPETDARIASLAAEVNEARARLQADAGDQSSEQIAREVLEFSLKRYADALERAGKLRLFAPQSGIVVMPTGNELEGAYVTRGELLGFVVDFDNMPATVMIPEDSIDDVRNRAREIEVRIASDMSQTYSARVQRIVPASTRALPSLVLALEGGGQIALDPGSASEPLAFKRYFSLMLDLSPAPQAHLNERVHVMFRHDAEPLIWRWWRGTRRAFLRQFDV